MVVFSNIYNHWIRDEFLNFENVIYDFFDPSGFDGVIVTAEAFLDISTMSLAEEIRQLRSKVKRLNKENKRLQEERDFLNEAAAFFAASRRK